MKLPWHFKFLYRLKYKRGKKNFENNMKCKYLVQDTPFHLTEENWMLWFFYGKHIQLPQTNQETKLSLH